MLNVNRICPAKFASVPVGSSYSGVLDNTNEHTLHMQCVYFGFSHISFALKK